jgi:hypothetical protein
MFTFLGRCMLRKMLLFSLLTFFAAATLIAQELNCEVSVNAEKINSAQREYLRNFESDVKKYMNDNKWTDEDLGGERIDCSMTIYFISVAGDNDYTAQIVVGSQRPVYIGNDKSGRNTQVLRIADDKWEFTYVPNQPMVKDEYRFAPLTGVLNYYAYLIIGMDLETYNELAGSQCFQKALNICNLAMSTAYSKDWQSGAGTYSRFDFLDELMNLKYQQFRISFTSYHFDGLDLLATKPQEGLDAMLKAIQAIGEVRQKQNPRSILVRVFFDSKYLEIAESFLAASDRSVYDKLIAADPTHQGTYDTYRSR